ncbi:uncharacterized protein [Apostichopus japonicus]|uniref:uncharacterized protein n=1 Tax=Stichopus japonicus TaxID=307972 RepID=UPI003AB538E3
MGPPSVNKPLRTVEKKKISGCRSMKTIKRKARQKKNRKVLWNKLILPNMEIDDDETSRNTRKSQGIKPMTGKKKRKLRKRMTRLLKTQQSKMEDVEPVKAEEESKQDAEAANDDTEMKEAE